MYMTLTDNCLTFCSIVISLTLGTHTIPEVTHEHFTNSRRTIIVDNTHCGGLHSLSSLPKVALIETEK